ncbi:hypothetical protein Q9Q95_12965 [Sphingomonas sp. DG1-23]|jgi:hypothetical protein|nr:hypothetical protein [Sphingomonas sp. DG1-23]MDP5279838.1 hypothetical protein [Sphingomonas sp. DG1-23]
MTLAWGTVITSGVPVGAQSDVLDWTISGWPFDSTRVVPVSHWPVTHGPLAAGGGGKAQPVTVIVVAIVMLGTPPKVTRAFTAVGIALPP